MLNLRCGEVKTDFKMLCRIADLYVEVPEGGGLDARCKEYITSDKVDADITILEERYDPSRWPMLTGDNLAYMDSGLIFYSKLIRLGGMMLHSSAVELDGKAYLFSGPCGMGKSTHTRLWKKVFEGARIFNDDKPALRFIDGVWYAYGTPWCGKDGININLRAPLAGICFLKRGSENKISRLSPLQATSAILTQTFRRFGTSEGLDIMIATLNNLVANVPVYELYCLPNEDAARLSHKTMSQANEEE